MAGHRATRHNGEKLACYRGACRLRFRKMRGFSTRDLRYMAFFSTHRLNGLFGEQPAAQLLWFHIICALTEGYAIVRA